MYYIDFKKSARKAWWKLDNQLKIQFSKKLEKIRKNPEIPKNKLSW